MNTEIKNIIVNRSLFNRYYKIIGLNNAKELFFNMNIENFNELYLDLAWIENGVLTSNNDLPDFINHMIHISANELDLSINFL